MKNLKKSQNIVWNYVFRESAVAFFFIVVCVATIIAFSGCQKEEQLVPNVTERVELSGIDTITETEYRKLQHDKAVINLINTSPDELYYVYFTIEPRIFSNINNVTDDEYDVPYLLDYMRESHGMYYVCNITTPNGSVYYSTVSIYQPFEYDYDNYIAYFVIDVSIRYKY